MRSTMASSMHPTGLREPCSSSSRASNSVGSSSSRSRRVLNSPCLVALRLAVTLPLIVTGPVLLRAFTRLAASRLVGE